MFRLRRGRVLAALLVLTMTALASATAWATVAKHMNLTALVERSDAIAHGVVVAQTSFMDEERDLVLTRTAIKVDRSYYGQVPGLVHIQQIGGETADRTTKIAGDATFEPGEEVIVFLKRGEGSVFYLTSMAQSKYRVTRKGSQITVQRDLDGLVFVTGPKQLEHIEEGDREGGDFLAELGALIAGIKGVESELELPTQAPGVKP